MQCEGRAYSLRWQLVRKKIRASRALTELTCGEKRAPSTGMKGEILGSSITEVGRVDSFARPVGFSASSVFRIKSLRELVLRSADEENDEVGVDGSERRAVSRRRQRSMRLGTM